VAYVDNIIGSSLTEGPNFSQAINDYSKVVKNKYLANCLDMISRFQKEIDILKRQMVKFLNMKVVNNVQDHIQTLKEFNKIEKEEDLKLKIMELEFNQIEHFSNFIEEYNKFLEKSTEKLNAIKPELEKLKSSAQKEYTKATTKIQERNNRGESRDRKNKEENKNSIFGVDLDELCERENAVIPYFVLDSINFLKETGSIDIVGLFRISGNGNVVNEVKQFIDIGDRVDFSTFDFNGPHVVTGLLKMFLRQLPDPLITHRFFEQFVAAGNIVPEHKAIEKNKKYDSTITSEP